MSVQPEEHFTNLSLPPLRLSLAGFCGLRILSTPCKEWSERPRQGSLLCPALPCWPFDAAKWLLQKFSQHRKHGPCYTTNELASLRLYQDDATRQHKSRPGLHMYQMSELLQGPQVLPQNLPRSV